MTGYPPFDGSQPCRTITPEVQKAFDGLVDPAQAYRVCNACPFTRECLEYALTNDVSGIWGGTTDAERRRLRRVHGLPGARDLCAELDELVLSWRHQQDRFRTPEVA